MTETWSEKIERLEAEVERLRNVGTEILDELHIHEDNAYCQLNVGPQNIDNYRKALKHKE